MNKSFREKVWNKHNQHCGYCGKVIDYKDMQIDHIIPKVNNGTNDISNLMPSCRRCNHYKHCRTLEEFRELIATLHTRLTKIYINNVALDYHIIELHDFDGLFYFEREKQ